MCECSDSTALPRTIIYNIRSYYIGLANASARLLVLSTSKGSPTSIGVRILKSLHFTQYISLVSHEILLAKFPVLVFTWIKI